jgi:hypothetical protein
MRLCWQLRIRFAKGSKQRKAQAAYLKKLVGDSEVGLGWSLADRHKKQVVARFEYKGVKVVWCVDGCIKDVLEGAAELFTFLHLLDELEEQLKERLLLYLARTIVIVRAKAHDIEQPGQVGLLGGK